MLKVLYFYFIISYGFYYNDACSYFDYLKKFYSLINETVIYDNVCSVFNEHNIHNYQKWKNQHVAIYSAHIRYRAYNISQCSCHFSQVSYDLNPFKNGIDENMFKAAKPYGTHYQVFNGKLYREKDCMFPSRCIGIEHFILKSDEYLDIMYPAWAFWEGGPAISLYPKGLGRWDLHRKLLMKEAENWPWRRKISKGFFRGSRTNLDRDKLVLFSRSEPALVDAEYTKNQAWKSEEDTLYKKPEPEVALEKHCQYKYLFNYKGVAASFRLKHLFLCKSLVFHVDDGWSEFFYKQMKPWIHYIPVSPSASQNELRNLIEFAIDNEVISEEIAAAGYNFIKYHLRMKDVICYWKKLLKEYSKLVKYKVKHESNFMHIF